jgi:hypothetical protein
MAKLIAIDGSNYVKLAETPATALQENASLLVIKEGIRRNKPFTYNEIVKGQGSVGKAIQKKIFDVYPAKHHLDYEWLETFYKQQETFLTARVAGKRIGTDVKYQEYDRDNPNGFMDFITDLVRINYGISQKDTWNPADIWIVEDRNKVREDLINAAKSPNINLLNDTMRAMFKQRKVIGISLKKITKGKPARWEVVNVEKTLFKGKDNFNFEVKKIRFGGDLKQNLPEFTLGATVIYISENNIPWVEFTINYSGSSRKYTNLKFEPTAVNARGARLGKSPNNMVAELMKEYKFVSTSIKELMNNSEFPKTLNEFLDDKLYYKSEFDKVKGTFGPRIDMGAPNSEAFINNVQYLYDFADKKYKEGTDSYIKVASRAHTKLMQLHFLSMLATKRRAGGGQKNVDQIMTAMTYLAMKKGKGFGPFGKLY